MRVQILITSHISSLHFSDSCQTESCRDPMQRNTKTAWQNYHRPTPLCLYSHLSHVPFRPLPPVTLDELHG